MDSLMIKFTNNDFGKEVVRLTAHLNTQPLWRQSSERLISIIGFYIFNIKNKKAPIKYSQLIKESYSLLQNFNDWETLSYFLLLTDNPQLKSALQNDLLFKNIKHGERKNNIILIEAKNRLNFLELITSQNPYEKQEKILPMIN